MNGSVEVHAVVLEEIWCGCGQEEEGCRPKGREAGHEPHRDDQLDERYCLHLAELNFRGTGGQGTGT